MKKIDMLTPIGILIGISMVVFGVISSGGMSGFLAFIDVPSILIVLGGVFGTLCVSFPLKQLKNMGKVGKQAFQSKEINVEEIDDLFVKKGILLAIDGVEPEMIRELLEAEIAALEERHARGRSMFEKAGDYAPAWGMIGTLVGLVLMLKSLNTPSSLGPNMAIALLTTFYGALLSNLFFQPIAAKLAGKTEHELFVKEVIIEGVIGLQAGQNSRFMQAKLKVFAPVEKRKLEEKREHVREA